MLEIKNLSIKYDDELVVENFNLSINKGEIVSIVGESGSGKTTVLKSILGALSEDGDIISGNIEFKGNSLIGLKNNEWNSIRGNKISMIFQDCGASLNPIRKIGSQFVEYIRIHSKISKDDAYNKAVEMLDKMHLKDSEDIMNSYPHQLSGGMRQRVGIAMAMTFSPELLLADEPTSALDVTTQAQIVKEMLELKNNFNTGIIFITHNLGVASFISDKIVVMQNGIIVDQGKTEDVLKNSKSKYTKKLLKSIPKMGVNISDE